MEENKKETTFLIECEECKTKVKGTSVNHKKEFKANGQSIFLTYYDCSYCGRRHFVQIDDVNSLQKLARVNNEFKSLAIKRQKGKTISKKQSDKFKKARQDLSIYRTNLMKEFTGKTITDVTGKTYELRFSIWA